MPIQRVHYTLLTAICASLFVTPLMVAGVNAVLPEIGRGIYANAAQASMVGAVYSLGLAVFQLAAGSLGDICGHKRLFLIGAIVFCLSSGILACVSSITVFLCLRLVQGVGAALISASGLALLASAATPEYRAAYLGLSGAAVYAGIACGPPIAGLLAGWLGWRALFWLAAAASLFVFIIMKYTVSHDWRTAKGMSFDWIGCLLYGASAGGLTMGVFLLKNMPSTGWSLLGVFAVFLVLFAIWEWHSVFPILDLKLLAANRVFALSSIVAFVNYASFFGIIFYFSFYLQIGKGFDARIAGFILALQPLVQSITTPMATRLCNGWGEGPVSAFGAAMCGCGLIASAFISPQSSLVWLLLAQVLLGIGVSSFSLANTSIILESAGRNNTGQASALTGAMRTAGQLCGMVLITVSMGYFVGNESVTQATLPGFMQSMHYNLALFAILNILAIAISFVRNLDAKK